MVKFASRLAHSAIENQGQEYVMTTPMDNTLTAIGRELSITFLPTVLEPLPRELNDLVAQLAAFEMRKQEFECDHLGYRDPPHHTLKSWLSLVGEAPFPLCAGDPMYFESSPDSQGNSHT
jgi:hypothetical protein